MFQIIMLVLVLANVGLAARNLFVASRMDASKPGRKQLIAGAIWSLIFALILLPFVFSPHGR